MLFVYSLKCALKDPQQKLFLFQVWPQRGATPIGLKFLIGLRYLFKVSTQFSQLVSFQGFPLNFVSLLT